MRTPCSICGEPSVARALCKKHYRAFMKHGNANHQSNLRGVPFEQRYQQDPATGCWVWIGGTCTGGYGAWYAHGESKAHRASWVLHNGLIPDGLHVLHTCDRPECVNPAHLRLGTHQDNMADLRAKGRAYGAKGEANYSAKITEEQALAIMSDGRTCSAIAKEFGISRRMVDTIRNGKSWSHLYLPQFREARIKASGRVTLSDEQKAQIAVDGRTQTVIAAEYGVSQSQVSVIKRSYASNYSK